MGYHGQEGLETTNKCNLVQCIGYLLGTQLCKSNLYDNLAFQECIFFFLCDKSYNIYYYYFSHIGKYTKVSKNNSKGFEGRSGLHQIRCTLMEQSQFDLDSLPLFYWFSLIDLSRKESLKKKKMLHSALCSSCKTWFSSFHNI